MKVLHVIVGLGTGGAEMMLYRLLERMERPRYESVVIGLLGPGPVGARIEGLGIPVHALGMRRGFFDPTVIWTLTRLIRRERPDVVQTWMYHANLAGGVAARLSGVSDVVWGIHNATLDGSEGRRTMVWTAKAGAPFSRWVPRRIVCCAESARLVHAAHGYDVGRMVVIPNGFDLDAFKPDPSAPESLREELGLPSDTPLIGLVARFDPQKDHRTFIDAAATLGRRMPTVHFVLCGDGVTDANPELAGWIAAAGLSDRVHLLGRRTDAPRIHGAVDISSMSSAFGEAFPLVIGEAMACGVPCVVTDIGDSALIVGETGRVVRPRDPDALARAWQELLELPAAERARLGGEARRRIAERFEISHVVSRYSEIYEELAGGKGAKHATAPLGSEPTTRSSTPSDERGIGHA